MSDERSDGVGGDGSSEADATSPGGGPKRVVSERSVDDILESLSDTKGTDVDSSSRTIDGQADERADTADQSTDIEREDSIDHELDVDDESKDVSDTRSTAAPADEGLEARIESGEVTGADVRAAEAGEGREPTPAVDEIDLTLEDVDRTSPVEGERGESTQTDSGEEKTEAADNDAKDGLLARIRGLFSR